MPKLQEQPVLKNNVLPFPSLQAAPKDPPRLTFWRAVGTLAVLGIVLGLISLTFYALLG